MTAILLRLHQFWNTIQDKLAYEGSYTTNIMGIRIKLLELQDNEKKIKKVSLEELLKDWEDIKEMFHY